MVEAFKRLGGLTEKKPNDLLYELPRPGELLQREMVRFIM